MKAPLIEELKARRQALGWSIADLGERCGIDEKLLSGWEHGVGLPRLDATEVWATALGLTLGLDAKPRDARPGVRIDWDAKSITVDGSPVRLTPMEWKALERLAKLPGELVTHEALFRHLYGDDQPYRVQSTAIRVLITKLRRLLPLKIEARWGRGYVVSGIDALPGTAPVARDDAGTSPMPRKSAEPTFVRPQRDNVALVPRTAQPKPAMPDAVRALGEPSEVNYANLRRVQLPQVIRPVSRPAPCRAEELGVIERFLAERGVTRCPDVATIQRSPLPTLVWDKLKRKWVRPPQPDFQQAS